MLIHVPLAASGGVLRVSRFAYHAGPRRSDGVAASVGRVSNRLASATSPYLLQHAQNPVDWWEWGPEAFAEARRRDVPILLSVGYAACHWCQVIRLTLGNR